MKNQVYQFKFEGDLYYSYYYICANKNVDNVVFYRSTGLVSYDLKVAGKFKKLEFNGSIEI